jgi:chemotaxis protein MotA
MEINVLFAGLSILLIAFFGLSDLFKDPASYLNLASFMIVFGLSLSALLISSSFKNFMTFLKAGKMIISPEKQMTPILAIEELVRLSKLSSSKGKVALNKEAEEIKQPFLKFGVQLLTEKAGYDFIKATLENDIEEIRPLHKSFFLKNFL